LVLVWEEPIQNYGDWNHHLQPKSGN